MRIDRVINQAIWEHHANTKGFPNADYLNDLEKIRKVLEIIKDKMVDMWNLKYTSTYKEYNRQLGMSAAFLSQEEYVLLKEVLL